jgi:nicotinamidase-related amidase
MPEDDSTRDSRLEDGVSAMDAEPLRPHTFALDPEKLDAMNRVEWQKYVRPESTALIMVDMQNDALGPKGSPTYGFGATPMWEAVDGLNNLTRLIATARRHDMKVFWVRCGFEGIGKDISPRSARGEFYAMLQAEFPGALSRETWAFELADEIKALVEPQDVIIDKTASSSFVGTDLQQMLVMAGVRTLLIGGCITDACVEGTARTGFDLGYHSIVVADISVCPSWERQYRSLYHMSRVYATITMTDEIVNLIDRNAAF